MEFVKFSLHENGIGVKGQGHFLKYNSIAVYRFRHWFHEFLHLQMQNLVDNRIWCIGLAVRFIDSEYFYKLECDSRYDVIHRESGSSIENSVSNGDHLPRNQSASQQAEFNIGLRIDTRIVVTIDWDRVTHSTNLPFFQFTMPNYICVTNYIWNLIHRVARIEALIHLCRFYAPNVHFSNWFTNASIYDLIQDMAPSFQHTLLYCMWQYKDDQCSTFFTEILTDEGLCFTFNALNSQDIYTNE